MLIGDRPPPSGLSLSLMRPFPAALIRMWPMSTRGNKPENDDPAILAPNRDRGEPRGSSPPTPPYIRVRIRRFGGLSGHLFPQEGQPPGFGSVYRRGRFGPYIT